MKICTVDNCNRKHLSKGFCSGHYKQYTTTGTIKDLREYIDHIDELCQYDGGCVREIYSKKLCKSHYETARKKKKK